jgi:hypothetical protein
MHLSPSWRAALRRAVLPALLLGTLALAACGGTQGTARAARRNGELLAVEEDQLASAVEKKRSGDPIGAWKLIEDLPASSPARLDPRYDEVMGAWADARSRQIGVEMTNPRGGGPANMTDERADRVETTPSADPPPSLSPARIEHVIAERRSSLRSSCFGDHNDTASFLLQLRIDTDGRVLDATLSDVKGDAAVAQCVRGQASGWTFPRSSEGGDYRTRFVFGR